MRDNISPVDLMNKLENESASTSYAEITVNNSDFEKFVDPKQVGVVFSREIRRLIFFLIIITNLIINMDHGTIPAATSEIKDDLKIDDGALGVFGSLVFFGNLLGAMIFFSIIRDYNRKFVILLSLSMILILIYLFAIVRNEYFLYFNRTLTGVFQSFLAIYFPVWCYQFGQKDQKNTMIAVLQLGVPLGVVLGYILTVVIKSALTWNYSLYIQCGLTGIVIIIFIFIPNIYFSATLNNERRSSMDKTENDDQHRKSDVFSIYKDIDENITEKTNLWGNLKYLCGNFLFLSFAMALGILYFIITVVQFWATDYLKNVLNTEEHLVSIAFTFTCISAPTLGIIFGCYTLSKAGGPQSIKSIIICLLYSIGGLVCSIPIPFANDVYFFTGFLWLILFFGGAMVPIITGIIITSVPVNLRSSGNSLSNFLSNLIGYLPGPFVYGLISKYEKEDNPRLAMLITMYTSALGMLFISIGCYFKFKLHKEEKVIENTKKRSIIEDLNKHAILIANLWGNNNINSKEIITIDEIIGNTSKSLNNKDSSDLFLDENDYNISASINDLKIIKEKGEKNNCICNINTYKVITDMIRCDSCNYIQHKKCIKNAAFMENYECPTCQFSKMDFKIKTVYTLLPPSLIENVSKTFKFNFKLTKDTYKLYSNMSNIFLFIRCIRLDSTGYENHWPFNCTIVINQLTFQVQFKKLPPRKMREDTPIIFYFNERCSYYKTEQFKLENFLNFDENKISISANFEENQDDKYNYAVTVECVNIINDYDDIIKNVPSVNDLNILRNLLKCSGNSIFFEEKISLLDIYNNNKTIKVPVRSINCQHLSVFDLGSYLMMNSHSKNWNCPICKKKSVRMYKDDFLLKLINENNGINEVKFNYTDLTYSILKKECITNINSLKNQVEEESKTAIEIIDLNETNKAITSNDIIETNNNLADKSIGSPELILKEDNIDSNINELKVSNEKILLKIVDQNPKKNIILTQNYYFKNSSLISHKRKQFLYLD